MNHASFAGLIFIVLVIILVGAHRARRGPHW